MYTLYHVYYLTIHIYTIIPICKYIYNRFSMSQVANAKTSYNLKVIGGLANASDTQYDPGSSPVQWTSTPLK